MLPHRYHPPLRNNAWERLAAEIAAEVFPGVEMVQVPRGVSLSTRPVFHRSIRRTTTSSSTSAPARATPSSRCTRTWRIGRPRSSRPTTRAPFTLTLAIDDETADNGCIRYVPGSQKDRKLRPHRPLAKSRDEGHAVVAEVADDEEIRLAEVPRGGVTLHDEWVVHGSPGNRRRGTGGPT